MATAVAEPSPNAAAARPWWRGAVIYQIYPRSFRDTNGDGIGDLAGIAEGLDYIADLGVDGIWISPFFTSPMKDFGYDVADYCGIDPSFGTFAEDFDRIIAKAHSARAEGDHRPGLFAHLGRSTPGSRRAGRIAPIPRPTGMSGPIPSPTAHPRPTGNRCSAVRPGSGTGRGSNITCTISSPRSPISTSTTARCRTRCSRSRVSGSGAASTASGWMRMNFAMHDPALRDNPPARPADGAGDAPVRHADQALQPVAPRYRRLPGAHPPERSRSSRAGSPSPRSAWA
ncbi:MAG: hypothetical protein KatS3mg120_1320 [Erythrobacter sp.]|nr:MAG: hypothetical protein KatS3mg120_1320 [Erythrobacter sp.]